MKLFIQKSIQKHNIYKIQTQPLYNVQTKQFYCLINEEMRLPTLISSTDLNSLTNLNILGCCE